MSLSRKTSEPRIMKNVKFIAPPSSKVTKSRKKRTKRGISGPLVIKQPTTIAMTGYA